MPRFFFHLESGTDDDGADLPSVQDARVEAARYAGRLLLDGAEMFWLEPEFAIRVTDDQGLTLFTLSVFGRNAPVMEVSPVIRA